MKLSRLKKLIFLHLQHLPMKSNGHRPLIIKMGGINIKNYKKTFIGENVVFDTNYPQDITIEEGVTLTVGCVIITHFLEIDDNVRRRPVAEYLEDGEICTSFINDAFPMIRYRSNDVMEMAEATEDNPQMFKYMIDLISAKL